MVRGTDPLRIVRLSEELASDVARLLRRCFPSAARYPHAPWNTSGRALTRRLIEQRVLSRTEFDPAGSFVALGDGRVVGFCLAALRTAPKPGDGYLCALAVEPRLRRQGVGSLLLDRAERYLARRGANAIVVSSAGNPAVLLGGVPMNAEAYPFLLNRGFRGGARNLLQVMSQDTARFRLCRPMRELSRRLEADGVRIGGMEARFLHPLGRFLARYFADWHDGILAHLDRRPPPPIVVAVQNGRLLGFAGPYSVTDSGLGNFFAVGVTPANRGRGIGAALFNRMCAELRSLGAHSTALTTGVDNPAQDIYVRAGFRARFVVDCGMRKELKRI